MDFSVFGKAVAKQFDLMSKQQEMFTANADKYTMWDTYLGSFEEGTNEIYITNTEHDCNCCKQFVRAVGNAVAFIDGELVTVWDIDPEVDLGQYRVVTDAMAKLVRESGIRTLFRRDEKRYGAEVTKQFITTFDMEAGENGVASEKQINWNHFHAHLPAKFVIQDGSLGTFIGKANNNYKVLKRSLTEISFEAILIVQDLIDSNAIHRGAEYKVKVQNLFNAKKTYEESSNKEEVLWTISAKLKGESAFRNTVIGTLLCDISDGKVDLEVAVKKYEDKVSGTNFKRSSALITEGMKQKAYDKVVELGLEDALHRRFAVAEDITINNVIFADNSVKKSLGAFDVLGTTKQKAKVQKLDDVQDMTIEEFIKNVLPKAESVSVFVDNKHNGNFVSLIAPEYLNAGNILKWDNNFSYSYNGEVADSMREQVVAAGGRVDGVLRFTHSWNHDGKNQSLMDLHVFHPGNKQDTRVKHDTYGSNERVGWNNRNHHTTRGKQDVDFTSEPGNKVPLENITYPKLELLPDGVYVMKVHNWAARKNPTSGFKAEIECGGQVYQYSYDKAMANKEWVTVAEVTLKNGEFTVDSKLPTSVSSREVWGVDTQQFQKVSMVMQSPNYWDGQEIGNQQYFFMIEGCNNPEPARGFYNEFLRNELHEHRKVFEVLGSKMKTAVTEDQLSGLGFSVTKRDKVLVQVRGSFNRTIRINF